MSTLSIPHRYVVGFAFSADMSRVLLIRKNRPLWMAGKLNGIGGRAEHGEGLVEAWAVAVGAGHAVIGVDALRRHAELFQRSLLGS